jgi:hypothetical protein
MSLPVGKCQQGWKYRSCFHQNSRTMTIIARSASLTLLLATSFMPDAPQHSALSDFKEVDRFFGRTFDIVFGSDRAVSIARSAASLTGLPPSGVAHHSGDVRMSEARTSSKDTD